MNITTHIFAKVQRYGKAKPVCKGCGLIRTRKIHVWQTVNPYNKNPDGSQKSRNEIVAQVDDELAMEISMIEAEGIVCRPCKKRNGI